jgi:RNA polymerase sigma-70 factor (ECF subfamily)
MDPSADDAADEPIEPLLLELKSSDPATFEEARRKLVEHSGKRLEILTRRMLRTHPRLRRWEETADVFQNALWRLYRSLESVRPETPGQFFGLAATQIRRELIDLSRHHFGPEGQAANHHTDRPQAEPLVLREPASGSEPETIEEWSRFHLAIDRLPEPERDVVHLLWYEGLSQTAAAAALGVSDRTIKTRWRNAKLTLRDALKGESPEEGSTGG